ncbi:hypothetical protein J4416_01960 [Candidatus Pacearchaeota archaeon]|nr:hypothetical protein [Candidatus Pacearchaeota archaeon]
MVVPNPFKKQEISIKKQMNERKKLLASFVKAYDIVDALNNRKRLLSSKRIKVYGN